MTGQQTPEQRATEAAEALATGGVAATARAMREWSGVRMTGATEAARSWNEHEAQAEAVPDPLAAVQVRFVALWREAVAVARGEFVEARTGWQAKVEQAQAERDTAAEDAERVEAERDDLAERLKDAHRMYKALMAARDEARAETDVGLIVPVLSPSSIPVKLAVHTAWDISRRHLTGTAARTYARTGVPQGCLNARQGRGMS